MEHFKNPYDARIKEIDDVLDKRFGEAKTAGDWEKRVKALEAEQVKLKEGGDDFSYYKKAIFDAKKKKAENMDDGSLEEQHKKISEFEALREEEDKPLREKIDAETDDKKREELKKDRNKKLAYYEKKINEVEDKIKPKSEEEFVKKLTDIEERRSEKLQRMGVNDKGEILADVTFFDSQLAAAQREFDKLISVKTDRPVQYVLETSLKELRTYRDKEIAANGASATSDAFTPAVKDFTAFVSDWRKLDSQKIKSARQWEARRLALEKLGQELKPALKKLEKNPSFASNALKIETEILRAINEQKELADDEITKAGGAQAKQKEKPSSQTPSVQMKPGFVTQSPSTDTRVASKQNTEQTMSDIMKEMAIAQESERIKKEREVLKNEKPIQFLVEDLISQLKKKHGTENIIDTLYQFEIDWHAIDAQKPQTGTERIKRLDALRTLKMELLNVKEALSDMKIDVDYDAIDDEIIKTEKELFISSEGKEQFSTPRVDRDTFEDGGGI